MSATTLQHFAGPESTYPVSEETLPTSDLALVRAAQRGDISAFEALYRSHVQGVYALCLGMVGNPALAEDLTQDVFVRAWANLGRFRMESTLGTWLHRIAVNVVLGALRKRREEAMDAAPEAAQPGARPGLAIDLKRAILSLPTRARLVFVLHDVEGYKHAEVARIAGIAVGTSKAQLHRARRLLASRLTHGDPSPGPRRPQPEATGKEDSSDAV